jgi:hypothetical protein
MNILDRKAVATTTYRRANGSQAAVAKPRVVRAPVTFPRAHTPSPAARQRANDLRMGRVVPGVTGATEDTL